MQFLIYCTIALIVSLLVAWTVYPKVLLISIHKNIVDSPNARKLQKMPVPILGGFVVFSGILASMLCVSSLIDIGALFAIFCIMTIMLFVGLADDITSLSARERFFIEIAVICILMINSRSMIIDDFHGLWGIHAIPLYIAIPLTIVAGVGIINAINLIDGVDGLSSGYCIFAFILFAAFFYISGMYTNLILALAVIGGLIPFFMHNVFGKYSKMFIGDAGTLLLGTVMAYFVITALDVELQKGTFNDNFGIIPMLLSILAVPVFDTLRVMVTRIIKGISPFNPDKTHLHHMFIRQGFSHIGTTISILFLNTFVVVIWLTAYFSGCSIDLQLYVVTLINIAITVLLYQGVERAVAKASTDKTDVPAAVKMLRSTGRKIGVQRGPFLKFMGRWMDRCISEKERKILMGDLQE